MPAPMERELTEPVDIALPDGRLRREAVGWARHPIQRCHLPPGLLKVHAFNYWCVTSRSCALTVLVADVRVAGVALVSFLDFATRGPVERVYVRPLGLPLRMPETPRGDIALRARRLDLELRACGPEGRDLRIEADARTLFGRRIEVALTVERPPWHETVNVVVPWDDERFHFTSKQQALPARGVVRVDGREHRFDADGDAFACLDFGRGRWPRGIEWGWAFAAGRAGARTIGLNLGARWTDGTGVTENAVVIDGRVHKIADAVDFTIDGDWRIRTRAGDRADLCFTPWHRRALRLPLGVAGFSLEQCVGTFAGTVVDDAGERLTIDGLVGLAETVHAAW